MGIKTNLHMHARVAERLIDEDPNLSVMSFFPFERQSKCWQYFLLKNVSDYVKVPASKDDYNQLNRLRTFLIKKWISL